MVVTTLETRDLELAHRIAAGDEAAASELVGRLAGEMYGHAVRMLRDTQAAEDVVQETLLAMLQGIERYDGRTSLRAWGYGILRHKILDALRRRRREPVLADVDPERDSFTPAGGWREADFRPWNEEAETLRVVEECLDRLPLPQREALELFALEGVPGKEAAEALGVSHANFRQILHRARAAMRRCVDQKMGHEPEERPS